MFKFIYRIIGKTAASKLDLQEGSTMDSKSWYKSKTIWTAIITVLIGAVQPLSEAFGHPIQIPEWLIQVLIGMGLYSLRTGDKTIK